MRRVAEATRALAAATLQAGRRIVAESASVEHADGVAPTILAIRRAALQLRLYLELSGQEILFFFVKRKPQGVRPIEASLHVAMQAVEDDGYLPPAQGTRSYAVQLPAFLHPAPSIDALRRHAPLVAFIEKLRAWVAGEQQAQHRFNLTLPEDPLKWNNVHTTLDHFVEGYLQIEIAMMELRRTSVLPPLDRVTPAYLPVDYQAEIALRLDRKGRFATLDAQDPLALTMKLQVAREKGALAAHITLSPPDFLVAGELRDAFLQALEDDAKTARRLREALKLDSDGDCTGFLTSARAHAVVFRTAHASQTDTDTIVLPGMSGVAARTVILLAEVTVKTTSRPPEVSIHEVDVGYDSLSDEDQAIDDKTAAYLARLCATFADWRSILS